MTGVPAPAARVAAPVAVFVVVGALALGFGTVDAVTAPRLQYQFLGLTYAGAGVTMLAACVCLLRPRWRGRMGHVASVLAGLAGFFVGGYLLVLQVRAPQGFDPIRITVWSLVALASLGAGAVGWRATHGLGVGQLEIGPMVKGLVSGVGAASLLFGGIQWWYTNQYLPGAVGAALSIETELEERVRPAHTVLQPAEELGPNAYPRVFDARVTISNQSRTTVHVVASIQYVVREPMRPAESVSETGSAETAQRSACFFEQLAPVQRPDCPEIARVYGHVHEDDVSAQDEATVSRYSEVDGAVEVLELGKAVSDGTYFEPEEEYTHSFPVHVPNSVAAYDDRLRLVVNLIVAKGQRLVLDVEDGHGPEQVQAAAETEQERVDNERQEGRQPRSYPHRYEVTEWRVRSLSEIVELTSGPQSINVIRVLSERNDGLVFESPYVVTCFSPAGRFDGAGADDQMRRDPTAVCPGIWFPPRNHYDRSLNEFYGMASTVSTELVSLMPDEQQPAGYVQSELPSALSYLPERSFVDQCAVVFDTADRALAHGQDVQAAVDHHAGVMAELDAGNLTAAQALEQGLPSLEAGAEASSLLLERMQEYIDLPGPCDAESSEAWEPRNAPCTDRVMAVDQALTHAMGMADALTTHATAMADLRDGRGARQGAIERGDESMATAVSESESFAQARVDYDQLANWCR